MRNGVEGMSVPEETRNRLGYRFVKRFLDILLSLIALVVLSPIFLIIAIIIKCTSKGHVFYKHRRVGMNGKIIYLYKFRSMVEGADQMIKDFNEEQKAEFQDNYKVTNDPRITKFGHLIRKTSIDELPQLINILKGEMSFIGPRPVVEDELEKYGPNKAKFLSVKPGLTGYWASHGRSSTSYEDRMKLELYYVDHASLWMDIKIFFKTFSVILTHEGAW